MKALSLILLTVFFAGTLIAQEGVLKTIGGAAKEKVKAQDFNSSRSNKEKGMLQNEQKAAPAPAPGATPDSTKSEPVTPSIGRKTDYKQNYVFDTKLVYENEDLNDSKDEKLSTTYYFGTGAEMVVNNDKSDMVTVVDFENEAAITFDEKNKTATVISTHWITQMAANHAKASDAVVTKTGQTKVINGYNCEEYIVQDKKDKYVQWVTSDIKIDYSKAMAALVKSMNIKVDGTEISQQTLLVEMTAYNKKGEAYMHMILKEFKVETLTKSLSGYKVSAL